MTMEDDEPAKAPENKRERLTFDQKKAALQAAAAKLSADRRRLQTRGKILVGTFMLDEAKKNPTTADWLKAKALKMSGRDRDALNVVFQTFESCDRKP